MPRQERGKVRAASRPTAVAAADAQTPEMLRASQQQIYRILSDRPSTDDELRAAVAAENGAASKSGPATRRGELADAGWVRPHTADGATVKRPSDAGHPMMVWEAVPAAEHVAPPPAPKAIRADAIPHSDRLAVARRLARWDHGDEAVADAIVDAYLNPHEAAARLDAEGAPR
jgi:hypothetical protein